MAASKTIMLLVTRIYYTRDNADPKKIHAEYKHEHVNKPCVIKPEGCNSIVFRTNENTLTAYQITALSTILFVPYLDDVVNLLEPVSYTNRVDVFITSDFKITYKTVDGKISHKLWL